MIRFKMVNNKFIIKILSIFIITLFMIFTVSARVDNIEDIQNNDDSFNEAIIFVNLSFHQTLSNPLGENKIDNDISSDVISQKTGFQKYELWRYTLAVIILIFMYTVWPKIVYKKRRK